MATGAGVGPAEEEEEEEGRIEPTKQDSGKKTSDKKRIKKKK